MIFKTGIIADNFSVKLQILQGNRDTLTAHKNLLERRLNARYVRFNPRAWTPAGQICMRVEVYVCHTYQGKLLPEDKLLVDPSEIITVKGGNYYNQKQ